MTESGVTRVAVYLDFDNIVISRYDQLHGRNSFQRPFPIARPAAAQSRVRFVRAPLEGLQKDPLS